MASSGFLRSGAIGFMLSGVTWVVLGLSAFVGYLQAIPGREDVVLFIVAHLLLAVGLIGLHALQKGGYGLLGRAGLYIALAAIATRILGAVVFLAGSLALQWISVPGAWAMLVGFVLYGVATLRARVLPRWYGLALIGSALILVLPVSLPWAITYGTTTLYGVILVVLGYVLWLRGREGHKQILAAFRSAFPDLSVTTEDIIAEGDKVVSRWRARGTHRGELMGIAPTGNEVTFTGIDVLRIAGGAVVERWAEGNDLEVMQQIGAMPASGQPEEAGPT